MHRGGLGRVLRIAAGTPIISDVAVGQIKKEGIELAKLTEQEKEFRRSIRDARRMIQDAEKADCNEAETRRRIERIFESTMGYDVFKHLSRERAIRGAGETEHVDFAIQIGEDREGEETQPVIMVEIKRVNVDLATKHLRQVSSYAINAGCEWILLTNSRDWALYHVAFGKPPVTKLIHSWNLLTEDLAVLAERFDLISYQSLKKGSLDILWQKTNVLIPRNMLQAILSEASLKTLRRELRKITEVQLATEDVIGGIRRLLNETALGELENIRISLPERKAERRKPKPKKEVQEPEVEAPAPLDLKEEEKPDLEASEGDQ